MWVCANCGCRQREAASYAAGARTGTRVYGESIHALRRKQIPQHLLVLRAGRVSAHPAVTICSSVNVSMVSPGTQRSTSSAPTAGVGGEEPHRSLSAGLAVAMVERIERAERDVHGGVRAARRRDRLRRPGNHLPEQEHRLRLRPASRVRSRPVAPGRISTGDNGEMAPIATQPYVRVPTVISRATAPA
jgi:hypothetical protein